jgi:hypothetical protein
MKPKRACFACGRVVAVRSAIQTHGGKARVPHKCPHGRWCVSGSPTGGEGYNSAPIRGQYACRECYDDQYD